MLMVSKTFKLCLLNAISFFIVLQCSSCVVEKPSVIEKISLVEINADNLSGFSTTQPFLPTEISYFGLVALGLFLLFTGIAGVIFKKKLKREAEVE